MSACPICFDSLLQVDTASPDVCDHVFCLTCLTKWSRHESFCPVDRKRFKKIINLSSKTVIQIRQRKRKKCKVLYDVSVHCEVCKMFNKDDTLLLCDCCDLGYHCECLTPPLQAVPSGRWFCPFCVSVEAKMNTKKGKIKGVKSSPEKTRNSMKRSNPRSSKMLPSSSSSSNSMLSEPDVSHNDTETPSESYNDTGQDQRTTKDLKNGEMYSDNSSSSQSQDGEILVSEQDYLTLNNFEKSSFLVPGISLSPKRLHTPSTSGKAKSQKREFSVFNKVDNTFSSDEKCLNISSNFSDIISDIEKDLEDDQVVNKELTSECQEKEETFEELNRVHTPIDETNTTPNDLAPSEDSLDDFDIQVEDRSVSSDISETEDGHTNSMHTLETLSGPQAKSDESPLVEQSVKYSETNSLQNSLVPFKHKRKCEELSHLEKEAEFTMDGCEIEQNFSPNLKIASSSLYPGITELQFEESDSPSNTLGSVNRRSDLNEIEIDLTVNPLLDFESRSSQYAQKAKMNLQKELQEIEGKKWKSWKPEKRLKFASRESLLDPPKKRTFTVEGNTNSGRSSSQNLFNIAEYTESVKRGTWRPENILILERYRDNALNSRRLKSEIEKQLGSNHNLNVFQVPDSQNSFLTEDKCHVYMTSFHPSKCKTNCTSSEYDTFQRNILQSALQVDLEELSIRKDGSLCLNWAKSN